MKRLDLILNGKGGVGKSFFAVNFVQFLKDKGIAHVAIDSDNENSTLKRFHPDARFLDLDILGSRMLEEQKRVGETAEAIELRQSGENSVLMTLALSVSDSVSQVLRWIYWWNSTEDSPETISEELVLLQLNTDFSAKGLTSEELTAIVAAWQAGAISRETMFDLFRRGEVLPAGRTDEEECRLTGASRTGHRANGTDETQKTNGKGVSA